MEIRVRRLIDDIAMINDLSDEQKSKLEVFDIEQLHVIEEILLFGVENLVEYFCVHHQYNADQMYEIYDAARLGLDYTILLDENYNYLQMRIIKFGLQMNIDISKYDDFKFTWDQMYQIYAGLIQGVNVDEYADYGLSVYEMIRIRKQLAA